MSILKITKSKVAHWEEYCSCLSDSKILTIIFCDLDEPHLKQIIKILDKRQDLLDLVTEMVFKNCNFGKSSNEKLTKLIRPSVKSLIFKQSRFTDDGAYICKKLLKISTVEQVSFFSVDLRRAYTALCKLILKGRAIVNLHLEQTALGEEYCQHLFETMKICSNLKSLSLNNVDYALDNMFPSIALNTSLTKLVIRANDFPYYLYPLNQANPKTNLFELQFKDFLWKDISSCTLIENIRHYYNLTKLVLNNSFHFPATDQLAISIKHLTNLRSLDITNIYFSTDLENAILSQTSITDLTCTGSSIASMMVKCQSVKPSVNFESVTLMYPYYDGIGQVKYSDLRPVLALHKLTKLRLNEAPDYDMKLLVEGLNSINCHLTELELVKSLNDEQAMQLASGLEHNTTLRKLTLKYNALMDPAVESFCDLLRVNRHIQYLDVTLPKKMNISPFKQMMEVLRVNKTLLYLEMPVASRDEAVDWVANQLTHANTTLMAFTPLSDDHRVDKWLHHNRRLRVDMNMILSNVMKSGSMLPLEIWLRIISYLTHEESALRTNDQQSACLCRD